MAEALGHVDSLQPPFSLINRDGVDEIAWCHAYDTGVIFITAGSLPPDC